MRNTERKIALIRSGHQLSRLSLELDISYPRLSRIFTGRTEATPAELRAICEALGVGPELFQAVEAR